MDARVESLTRRFAAKKQIDAALLLAVIEVECAQKPFEDDGVTPRLLFERHIFYKQLRKNEPDKLQGAINKGLAIPQWSRTTQYKDQGSSKGRLALLERAKAVDMEQAYASCSWGMGQVMGFNANMLGYGTATQMFSEMRAGGLNAQIDCMWRFMETKKLIPVLKKKDWAKFAEIYNGPAYAQNDYDTRLASAYKHFKDREKGEDPENDEELPLGRTPVQNAEPVSAWKTPEGVATGVGAATGAGTAIAGAAKVEGPVGYALAFVIVGAFVVGAFFFIKRLRRNPE